MDDNLDPSEAHDPAGSGLTGQAQEGDEPSHIHGVGLAAMPEKGNKSFDGVDLYVSGDEFQEDSESESNSQDSDSVSESDFSDEENENATRNSQESRISGCQEMDPVPVQINYYHEDLKKQMKADPAVRKVVEELADE